MSSISNTINNGIELGISYPSPLTITNSGIINAGTNGFNGAAVYAAAAQSLELDNDGRIFAAGTVVGVHEGSDQGLTVTNTGTISAAANGIYLQSTYLVTNSGTIVSSGGVAIQDTTGLLLTNASGCLISGYAGGIQALNGTVSNSGTIRGFNTSTTASADGVFLTNSGTVGNYGLITAAHDGFLTDGAATVTNTGTINAGYNGVQIDASGTLSNSSTGTIIAGNWGVRIEDAASVTNAGTILGAENAMHLFGSATIDNTGHIIGADGIVLAGPASLVNSGTISGTAGDAIDLGAGGTISNAAAGVITSAGYTGVYVSSGAGTVTNAGTISGFTGIVFYSTGTASQTVIDSGTIAGVGGTAIAFGAGNDLLKFQPSTSAFIQGIVNGGSGTNTLEFASAVTTGTLTGSGLDFINFGNGTVDTGADWVLAGSDTFGSSTTLTNSGTLTDAGTLVDAGTIIGGITFGTGAAPLSITSSGLIARASGNAIYGSNAATWTVNNAGTVQGGTAGINNYGVLLKGNGSVTNGSSGATTALISGRIGVEIRGTGQIDNYATLSGTQIGAELSGLSTVTNHAGASITGGNDGLILNGASETAVNSGTITGAVAVAANLTGDVIINGTSGGTVGLMTGSSFGAVLQASGNNTIFNYGTITAGVGVYDNGAGGTLRATVINAGTIIGTGGTAISSGALGSSNLLLRFVPGNSFIQGTVSGEHSGVGILQFASGASTGTLTGSNADFVNFQTASVYVGASWVFAGTNTLGANTTLVDAGTLTNSGVLDVTGTLIDSGTLVNGGSLVGNPITLSGGYLTNLASGYISANINGAAAGGTDSVVNQGTINNPGSYAIYLRGQGNVTNGAGASIYGHSNGVGLNGVNATISNLGTITAQNYAGYLRHGGLVINGQSGSGTSTAVVQGYIAILITSSSTAQIGTVLNYGTVLGSGGEYANGVIVANRGTVINGASGATAALIEGSYFGVGIGSGLVANYATISATSNGYRSAGVYIHGSGTVNNLGTASLIEGYSGVEARLTSTVANSGSIDGYIFGIYCVMVAWLPTVSLAPAPLWSRAITASSSAAAPARRPGP